MDYESVKYVEGFVENIIFRNEDNGYTVFEIEYKGDDITCVGTLSSVDTGEFIAADGVFVKHPSYYTMQFKISSYEFKTPTDAESVKRYLSSGAIKGIGAKMAERIVKEFGEQTFEILDKEPERLADIKGISYNKAMDIAQQYAGKRDTRKAVMYLSDYGIQMNLANKIFKKYGNSIYTIITDNPYKLADDIEGIGFKKADAIATKVGIKGDSDFRIKSGLLYCLNQATLQGHTYLPYDKLKYQAEMLLDVKITDYEHYISDLAIDKKIYIKKNADGVHDIFHSHLAHGTIVQRSTVDVNHLVAESNFIFHAVPDRCNFESVIAWQNTHVPESGSTAHVGFSFFKREKVESSAHIIDNYFTVFQ